MQGATNTPKSFVFEDLTVMTPMNSWLLTVVTRMNFVGTTLDQGELSSFKYALISDYFKTKTEL